MTSLEEPRLQEAFKTLTGKLGIEGLRLVWMPSVNNELSGEVKDGTVYIYTSDLDKAIETLKHELVDCLLTSRIVNPLVQIINLLIKLRENEIYEEKEKLVEVLFRLF